MDEFRQDIAFHSPVKTKFCKHCGSVIDEDCVVCIRCGKQVELLQYSGQPNITIHNSNTSSNVNTNTNTVFQGKPKRKWVAFFLCIFLGYFGAHKFYEGKIGVGILYLFTLGLFFVGIVIDIISLLGKPDPYYV